jgi:hypothetical protein
VAPSFLLGGSSAGSSPAVRSSVGAGRAEHTPATAEEMEAKAVLNQPAVVITGFDSVSCQ